MTEMQKDVDALRRSFSYTLKDAANIARDADKGNTQARIRVNQARARQSITQDNVKHTWGEY